MDVILADEWEPHGQGRDYFGWLSAQQVLSRDMHNGLVLSLRPWVQEELNLDVLLRAASFPAARCSRQCEASTSCRPGSASALFCIKLWLTSSHSLRAKLVTSRRLRSPTSVGTGGLHIWVIN